MIIILTKVNGGTENEKSIFYLITGLLVLFLAACGGDDSSEESGSNENGDNQTESESSNTYEVEHAMGTATIEEDPEKIVVLTNHGTEALLFRHHTNWRRPIVGWRSLV